MSYFKISLKFCFYLLMKETAIGNAKIENRHCSQTAGKSLGEASIKIGSHALLFNKTNQEADQHDLVRFHKFLLSVSGISCGIMVTLCLYYLL